MPFLELGGIALTKHSRTYIRPSVVLFIVLQEFLLSIVWTVFAYAAFTVIAPIISEHPLNAVHLSPVTIGFSIWALGLYVRVYTMGLIFDPFASFALVVKKQMRFSHALFLLPVQVLGGTAGTMFLREVVPSTQAMIGAYTPSADSSTPFVVLVESSGYMAGVLFTDLVVIPLMAGRPGLAKFLSASFSIARGWLTLENTSNCFNPGLALGSALTVWDFSWVPVYVASHVVGFLAGVAVVRAVAHGRGGAREAAGPAGSRPGAKKKDKAGAPAPAEVRKVPAVPVVERKAGGGAGRKAKVI